MNIAVFFVSANKTVAPFSNILEQLSEFSHKTYRLVVSKTCHEYLNFHPTFVEGKNGAYVMLAEMTTFIESSLKNSSLVIRLRSVPELIQ